MIKEITDIKIINKFLKEFNTSIKEIGVYSNYVGFYQDNEIVGFLSFDLMYERAEIEYIFTVEKYRNQSIASKLFDYMVEKCKVNNCLSISLEVRKSNINAINFYKKHGFEEKAIRNNYYNGEDGLLMVKELR